MAGPTPRLPHAGPMSEPISPADAEQRRMRRYYRVAFYAFVVLSVFYLVSGVLGIVLAGVEMVGPPPEAEIPVAPPLARMLGAVVVALLGVPGLIALFRRRERIVIRFLKIGGIFLLLFHAVLVAASLEAPRVITVMLLGMAILGMWITLVAFHPRTPEVRQWKR